MHAICEIFSSRERDKLFCISASCHLPPLPAGLTFERYCVLMKCYNRVLSTDDYIK
jgi:hypothetical protein